MTNNPPGHPALERLDEIIRLSADDEVTCSLLEKLLASAETFFCTVIAMETRLKVARLRLDVEELRVLHNHLVDNRRRAHEALIADLHIFNRYVLKEFGNGIPTGGIYSKSQESIENPDAIADWAGELLTAIYQNRRR